MTIVEIAALLVAVVFAVLVGYLVPVLMQVRKTVAESEQLLSKLNAEMPALVAELRAVSQNLNDVTNQAREGVDPGRGLKDVPQPAGGGFCRAGDQRLQPVHIGKRRYGLAFQDRLAERA